MEQQERDLLRKIFDFLPENTLPTVVTSLKVKVVQPGERIITQGDKEDKFYIIQHGKCNVNVEKDGELFTIASLEKGNLVGEMAMLTGEKRAAHVDAETEMLLWEIDQERFDRLCDNFPELREFLTRIIEERLITTIFKEDRDIGKYVVQKKIGKGNLSIVYKGLHRELNMPVAVKMLKHNMAMDVNFFNKFKEEAQIIVQLTHENIIKVFDIVNLYRTIFLFMEFLEGSPLSDNLKNTPQQSFTAILDLILQACAGLAYSHESGLVHQDIRPSNIFVLPDGHVKLIDFGIAFSFSKGMETPLEIVRYMSPEQIAGKAPEKRMDVFSLGITAFEMITGKVPFDASDVTTLKDMITNKDIQDPKSLRSDVPDELSQFVLKATNKDPDKRYQNMSEIINELKPLADKLGVHEHIYADPSKERVKLIIDCKKEQKRELDIIIENFCEELKKRNIEFNIS